MTPQEEIEAIEIELELRKRKEAGPTKRQILEEKMSRARAPDNIVEARESARRYLEPTWDESARAGIVGFADTVAPFYDELAAGAKAAGKRALFGDDLIKTYKAEVAKARAPSEDAAEYNPTANYVGSAVGTAADVASGAGAAGVGQKLAGKALAKAGAKVGGVGGMLGGFFSGEGAGESLAQGAVGGLAGAALGGAPGVGRMADEAIGGAIGNMAKLKAKWNSLPDSFKDEAVGLLPVVGDKLAKGRKVKRMFADKPASEGTPDWMTSVADDTAAPADMLSKLNAKINDDASPNWIMEPDQLRSGDIPAKAKANLDKVSAGAEIERTPASQREKTSSLRRPVESPVPEVSMETVAPKSVKEKLELKFADPVTEGRFVKQDPVDRMGQRDIDEAIALDKMAREAAASPRATTPSSKAGVASETPYRDRLVQGREVFPNTPQGRERLKRAKAPPDVEGDVVPGIDAPTPSAEQRKMAEVMKPMTHEQREMWFKQMEQLGGPDYVRAVRAALVESDS